MNEFDKRLADSLKTVTTALREERAARVGRARSDLVRRYRRRRITRFVPLSAAVGVTAIAVAFAVTQSGDLFRGGPTQPTAPARPAGTYIGVADKPVGVSVGNGIVWVASESGWLTEVDPETEKAVARIPVGGSPSDIALTNDLAWYSDSADGTVKRVGTSSGQFVGSPVVIGSLGHIDVDIGPKGTVWVASPDTGTLHAIDAATGDEVNQKFVDGVVELGIGPGALWSLGDNGATLVRIDFSTGEESLRVPVGSGEKTDLAVTSESVFVAAADGTITQLAADDGSQVARVDVAGTNPELAVGRGALWVASSTGHGHAELARLDLSDLHPLAAPKKLLATPTDVALGEGSVWVTDSSRDALVRVNAR